MRKTSKHIIVYSFQSLNDPLLKGLMLQYLVSLNDTGKTFHLITHEQKAFELSKSEQEIKKNELAENNIIWHPIPYHNGKFLLIKKLYDFLVSFFICLKIKFRYRTDTILGFLPIAGGYSAIIASVLRLKLVVYCFEPHSEYMADFKIWPRKSLKFLLLKKFEREQIEVAKDIIVPTSYTYQLVKKINPFVNVYTFPISIDTDKNIFDVGKRNELRSKLNIGDKKVVFYMGKFGGIYYDVPTLCQFLSQIVNFKKYHILIISPDKKEVDEYLKSIGINETSFTVLDPVPYDILHHYISVADVGIVAVPPLPSQIYRTPVKTGLYLSCGIPYLINKGIAEDDIIASQNRVGVVVEDFNKCNIQELTDQIEELWNDELLQERCRQTAVGLRSHKKAIEILKHILIN